MMLRASFCVALACCGSGGELITVPRPELCVTSGRIDAAGDALRIDAPATRAVAARAASSSAELAFR